jgi:hypothetical protein
MRLNCTAVVMPANMEQLAKCTLSTVKPYPGVEQVDCALAMQNSPCAGAARMKPLAAALLLVILLSVAALPAAADQPNPSRATERLSLLLDRLHAPAKLPLTRAGGSCATSCGSGPEGSCTKSCSNDQSCQASCAGGKAVCSCQ